jgi:DNA primase
MGKGLLEVLEENNIKLTKRSGDRWVAHCPFHEGDRSPSFTVYPNMTYFCFGCRAWGDAVKFLVDYKAMPVYQAMEYVGEEARKRIIKKTIKVTNTGAVWPYLFTIAEEYHKFLQSTPGAIAYLHYRGLTDETINKFNIGFTDGGVLNPQNAIEYQLALNVGLISEDGYEVLSHRIIIPNLLDDLKLCDFMVGRTVTKDKLKYLGIRVPKPIYGLIDVADSPIVFIVEGQFDWLMLRQWGYPSIVIGGTHIQSYNLVALRSKKVVIIPDNDQVGQEAAQRTAEKLRDCIILDYKDLNTKDVADLGTVDGGMAAFDEKLKEQISWISDISPTLQAKWFPRLVR